MVECELWIQSTTVRVDPATYQLSALGQIGRQIPCTGIIVESELGEYECSAGVWQKINNKQ